MLGDDPLRTRLEARVTIRQFLRERGLIEKEQRDPHRNLQALRHPSATKRPRPLLLERVALRFGKQLDVAKASSDLIKLGLQLKDWVKSFLPVPHDLLPAPAKKLSGNR